MTAIAHPAAHPVAPELRDELERPHGIALAALGHPDVSSLPAVTWSATHLAAVAQVLHPFARKVLPPPRAELDAAVAADHALQQALWWLDRRLTGDARVAHHDLEALEHDVVVALAAHARCERVLVEELAARVPAGDQQVLASRVAAAVRRSPTRPHPGAPVSGPLAGLAGRVDAGADHVRDLLDSRAWPTPHDVPAPRRPGRWGSYLLGIPYRRS